MKTSDAVVKALAVCSELCGANLSDGAARVIVGELAGMDEADVLAGLTAMRRTHEGRFSLAVVLRYVTEARAARISSQVKCCICGKGANANGYCHDHNNLSSAAASAKPLSWHFDQYRKRVAKNGSAA